MTGATRNTVNVLVGGEAGQGLVTVGEILTKALVRSGYHVHDTRDREAAMRLAAQWGEEIPVGVIYENDRPPFEKRLPALEAGPLVGRTPDRRALAGVLEHHA